MVTGDAGDDDEKKGSESGREALEPGRH